MILQGIYLENCKKKKLSISVIHNNLEKQFEKYYVSSFYDEHGILQEFSTLITPQQNGADERKNKAIEKMAQTKLECTFKGKLSTQLSIF